jgi:hypothetical protein
LACEKHWVEDPFAIPCVECLKKEGGCEWLWQPPISACKQRSAVAHTLEPDNNPSVVSKVALIVISFGKSVSEPS